jgi:hypothetical protein
MMTSRGESPDRVLRKTNKRVPISKFVKVNIKHVLAVSHAADFQVQTRLEGGGLIPLPNAKKLLGNLQIVLSRLSLVDSLAIDQSVKSSGSDRGAIELKSFVAILRSSFKYLTTMASPGDSVTLSLILSFLQKSSNKTLAQIFQKQTSAVSFNFH